MDYKIKESSRLAAKSLLHTSSYESIYYGMNDEQREKELIWLFERNILLISNKNPSCLNFFYDENNNLICFFILILSTESKISLCEKISVGLLLLPFHLGINTFLRLLEISDWIDEQMLSVVGDRLHLSLQRMVVASDLQGQGVGTKYLSLALRKADENNLPIVLSTQLKLNTIFYERLGFKVVKECYFIQKSSNISFYSWFMIREPLSEIK